MKYLLLTVGLAALLAPAATAQDAAPAKPASDTPAATAKDELPERARAALGTYKADASGAPTLVLKAQGKQLILAATGFPDLPVTLDDKDRLTNPLLPAEFAFTLVRDKDGKVTGLDVKTPMGGGVFQRTPPEAEKKPAPAIPDILGKYAADQPGPITEGEIKWEKDRLVIVSEGQPDHVIAVGKDDLLSSSTFPEGVTAKLTRDKEGKVTGLSVSTPDGNQLTFTRKTFPKPPAPAAEKKDDAALARLKGVTGVYRADNPQVPVVTVSIKEGKLKLEAMGYPEIEVTLSEKDQLSSPGLPPGMELFVQRDKDGKATGIQAKSPQGDIVLVRTPLKDEKPAEEKKADEKAAPAAKP